MPPTPVPTLVLFTQAKPVLRNPKAETGIGIVLLADQRWARRDIKTVQLLASSLAKMEALRQGADDAWLVEEGLVTEASSASAHIVTPAGRLVTRELGPALLHGVTRGSVLDLARKEGIGVEERAFTPDEARGAAEAFITSATNFVMPVVRIDGQPVGSGRPGPVTLRLRARYIEDRLAHAL
jgi:D-alanine transaminase